MKRASTYTPAMSKWLGPYVRLEGISITQLPTGGKGADSTAPKSSKEGSSPTKNVKTFVTDVLSESIPFIDGVAPKAGTAPTWKKKSSKRYASSEAPVDSYEYAVPGKELDKINGMNQFTADRSDERWFCRRSVHRNAAEKGTATWDEFTHSFKDHHAESEDAFTPTVIGSREAMSWDTQGMEISSHGGTWVNPTVCVVEMKHKIDPKPLKNRTFPVVQVTASLANTQEFFVISIPLTDFQNSPHSEFARDKSLVVGSYASIERIRVLPKSGEIEWIMATASNAGGVLPQWIQNLAVGGMVAHDVDLFMAWIPSLRKGKGKERAPAPQPLEKEKKLPIPPAASGGESVMSVPPTPISKDPMSEKIPVPAPKVPAMRDAKPKPNLSRRESMNKSLPAAPAS